MNLSKPLPLLLLLTAACAPLGALAYKLQPDPTQDARYKLKDRPTAILVENFENPDLAANDAELLTRNLYENITKVEVEKKKLAPFIPFQKVLDLRNSKPKDFPQMSMSQIGKAVGAEQLIYVDLQNGGVAPLGTGAAMQGKAHAMVKVIDVETGDTLWPNDLADGYPVSAQTNPLAGQDASNYNAVREDLYDTMADQIAKLFYKYTIEHAGEPSKIGTD